MNEIKKIHLGRQPFTISVEAHHELQAYLNAIEHQVGKNTDVLKEVESRMAELLTERNITSEKVVLSEDVTFLKEQLGEPGDFKDEDDAETSKTDTQTDEQGQKHLYRDTENGMIAGVASGLAAYFGIDVLIVRLIFVVLTLAGASGVLIYLLLWLLVPEAKTTSERLQMRGKAVTVGNLKEVIDRADVPAAAGRFTKVVRGVLRGVGSVVLATIGAGLLALGAAIFLGGVTMGVYLFLQGVRVAGDVIFPVGAEMTWGLVTAMLAVVLLAILLAISGVALLRRKAVASGWVVTALVSLFFVTASVATAIGIDTVPELNQTYRSYQQTQVQQVPTFSKVELRGRYMSYEYMPSSKYEVEFQYKGKHAMDLQIPVEVVGDTLKIDTTGYPEKLYKCSAFCLYDSEFMHIVIRAPKIDATILPDGAQLEQTFPAES